MSGIKFVIWGAGIRGKRLLFHLRKENTVAFVDTDEEKVGKYVDGVAVISLDEFIKISSNVCTVISTHEEEIVPFLEEKGINNYFLLSDCPEDFISSNPRDILLNHIIYEMDSTRTYMIYGNSLFSILLFQRALENRSLDNCYLNMGIGCSLDTFKLVNDLWPNKIIDGKTGVDIEFDKVLVTTQSNETDLSNYKINEIENIYLYSETHGVYKQKLLEQYKGIHQGKRCFIVATGPSLQVDDLNCLMENNEICFGVNSIYKIFEKTKWRPTYYVAADYRVVQEEGFDIDFFKDTTCFIADNNAEFNKIDHDSNINIFHSGQFSNKFKHLPFSEDISNIVYSGGTVCYSVIQIAAYMGFEEVYLLGTDASGIEANYQKYDHFYAEKELDSVCFGPQVKLCYETAREYADGHQIVINNATRGGQLEVFKRVDFDSLFL